MVFAVQLELVLSGLLTLVLDILIRRIFPRWQFPIVWELLTVSFIVGSITTAYVAKRLFMPMKRVRAAMDKVADGDFTVRLDTDGTGLGEVKELYAGFNLMAHELSSTEMLQSDFVSNVSHEFKTPINAIEGYATLLQERGLSDEARGEYTEKILLNTKRLSGLVGNILLLSKLDNQLSPPPKRTYRLDEQIRQSILLYESEWVRKDIEFDVELDEVEYEGNEGLLHHVWDNLISNAIKFNPQNGLIRLRLTEEAAGIRFTIEDSGPGIAEDALRKVFDKFYQEDTSHKQAGNGLGLALAKRIVDCSGGEIFAENMEGGGCRFTVVLKRSP